MFTCLDMREENAWCLVPSGRRLHCAWKCEGACKVQTWPQTAGGGEEGMPFKLTDEKTARGYSNTQHDVTHNHL